MMKPDLKPGVEAEVSAVVTEDMCPAFDGIIVHRVYSTWALAHHMELAARKVLAPHLEPQPPTRGPAADLEQRGFEGRVLLQSLPSERLTTPHQKTVNLPSKKLCNLLHIGHASVRI